MQASGKPSEQQKNVDKGKSEKKADTAEKSEQKKQPGKGKMQASGKPSEQQKNVDKGKMQASGKPSKSSRRMLARERASGMQSRT
jgi:hypothetical protein